MVPLCLCLDWYNNDFEIRLLWRGIGLDKRQSQVKVDQKLDL